MGTGHSHGFGEAAERPASPRVRRFLLLALAPFLLATVVGLVVLWPEARLPGSSALDLGFDADLFDGIVRTERIAPCAATAPDAGIECRVYDREKFHAKAYITHARLEVVGSQALVGSSNFTAPGLTKNIELNIQV